VVGFTGSLVTGFPALALEGVPAPSWVIPLWGLLACGLGLAVGLLLRGPLVERLELPFPTSRATVALISSLRAHAGPGRRAARGLLMAALLAAFVVWARDGKPAWIPAQVGLPTLLGLAPLGLAVSPMLLGAGGLLGVRGGLALAAGAVVAWGIIAPRLAEGGAPEYGHAIGWLLWPGVGLAAGSTLVSLGAAALRLGRPRAALADASGSRAALPLAALGALGLVALGWLAFGVSPIWLLLGVAAGLGLAAATARSVAEADIAPITQVGQSTQVLLGAATPGQAVPSLLGASIAAGVASQCYVSLWAFKSGRLLGGSARHLAWAQVFGVVIGLAGAVPAYLLLQHANPLGQAELTAPAARAWVSLAELARQGTSSLPPGAPLMAVTGLGFGALCALLERTRLARFVPSPATLGIGFLAPPQYALALALGAFVWAGWARVRPAHAELFAAPVASGCIAGEAVVGIAVAALLAAGVL
jgi:uncharacterized oligopeptide transporter (OPT) family protein